MSTLCVYPSECISLRVYIPPKVFSRLPPYFVTLCVCPIHAYVPPCIYLSVCVSLRAYVPVFFCIPPCSTAVVYLPHPCVCPLHIYVPQFVCPLRGDVLPRLFPLCVYPFRVYGSSMYISLRVRVPLCVCPFRVHVSPCLCHFLYTSLRVNIAGN